MRALFHARPPSASKGVRAAGIEPTVAVDEAGSGPGWLMLTDPDGNPVLIDQHR